MCTSLVVHCKYESFFIHEQVLEQKINVYYDSEQTQSCVVQVAKMGLAIKKEKKRLYRTKKRAKCLCV